VTDPAKKIDECGPSVLQLLRLRIARDLKTGELEHGDRLPSVREVGDELGVDPRTVLAAYQQLVEEGLVEIRSRSGVFATGAFAITGSALGVPRRWMLDTLVGAIERDIPASWLTDQVRSVLVSKHARVALLECNDDQLVSMREELKLYFGLDVVAYSLDSIAGGAMPSELGGVDFLVSAGHAEIVARVAAKVNKPFVITQVRPALLNRLSRLLSRGAVYFLVADSRFGVKMRRLVAPMPRSENLHVLIVGQDDLGVIPEGAPTYVMRSVQPALAKLRHRGRESPPQRIFAEKTIREILSRMLDSSNDNGDRATAARDQPM
jgi:GntR family transcriptional regulator